MAERYWIETLGCPKNRVDSDKLAGTLTLEGLEAAPSPAEAELVVVNTCAFIESAREESIETVLSLAGARATGARLVVTGCLAERYADELAEALPEVDLVAPFGTPLTSDPAGDGVRAEARVPTAEPVALEHRVWSSGGSVTPVKVGRNDPLPSFDLLNLPRPAADAPWAYLKVAEGCDRRCGFCAIPSFRGRQRSRTPTAILEELEQLGGPDGSLGEVVLVAQDLASYGLDRSAGDGRGRPRSSNRRRPIVELVEAVATRVPRTRLLYLYPSSLDDALVDAILSTGVPYFDLSLQHVSRPLIKRMRRWGDGDVFLDRVRSIRASEPDAAFRSSFIVGYPGETEADHDRLLEWLDEAQLDWVGFFPFSNEAGTYAARLGDRVPDELVRERLRECSERQDAITSQRRDQLIGSTVEVLVDAPGEGRTYREAPEIDGVVAVPSEIPVGSFVNAVVTGADGPDLTTEPLVPEGPGVTGRRPGQTVGPGPIPAGVR